jgi:hypothetical protein
VNITDKMALQYLKKHIKKDKSAFDPSCWSSQLLALLAGANKFKWSPAFLVVTARIVARIANCDDIVAVTAQLLACGEPVAFHKLNELQRMDAEQMGAETKVRPVNIGVCLLKWAMKLLLSQAAVT